MTYTFSNISEEDRKPVIDIFNYYIENSFAAYLEKKVAYDFFDIFLTLFKGYPSIKAKDSDGRLVGFSFLRAHHPASGAACIRCGIRLDRQQHNSAA